MFAEVPPKLTAGEASTAGDTPVGTKLNEESCSELPSTDSLLAWLDKVGFQNPALVDVNVTSTEEQRSTDWMTFHSLADFLDPEDPSKSIEGYPAPMRAVVTAQAPGNWEPAS